MPFVRSIFGMQSSKFSIRTKGSKKTKTIDKPTHQEQLSAMKNHFRPLPTEQKGLKDSK
jgi:hypothetical protein